MNEINFPKNETSEASFWAQEQDNSDPNWVIYDFLNLALQAVTVATEKPNFAYSFSLLPPISTFNAPNFPKI